MFVFRASVTSSPSRKGNENLVKFSQSKMTLKFTSGLLFLVLVILFAQSVHAHDEPDTLEMRITALSGELDRAVENFQQAAQNLGDDSAETLCYYCYFYTEGPTAYSYTPGGK
jgi:hypothetical protein